MTMKLPQPQERYDQPTQTRTNSMLEQADNFNRKKGAHVELVQEFLILRSPNGARWKVVVSNSGALSAVAL